MADPLSIAASIAGLLSLADSAFRGVFRYTQDASNAQKDIKALCTELQSVAVVLHGVKLLTETLEQDTPRSSPLRLEHVHSCRAVLNEILGRIVRFDPTPGDNKSIKHAMQALKWPFGKSRTMEMVNELSRQKETLQLALQASTMADLMACLSKVQNVESKLDQIQKSVESLEVLTRIKIDELRTKILDFFMVDDPSPNLRTSWDLRQPMTGLWLTESPRFREWLAEPRSKLWLSGIPGAGKTVLAGAVIREALSRLESTSNVGVAFFFCDYKKKSSWEISNILRALIAQLGRQQDSSFQMLEEYYNKIQPHVGFRTDPDIDDLRDLFVRQANEYDQVLVVVDGLDECGGKAGEVSRMLSEVAQYAWTISMALCSRHEADISDQLEIDFDHIPIAAHTQDISLYVGAELEKRIEQKRLRLGNASLKDEIMTRLIEGAQGMFRWVACQLDALCECPTDADRRAALDELPRTLPETYERILHRINQRHGRVQRFVQLSLKLIAVEEEDFKVTIPQLCQAVSIPDKPGVTLDKEAIVREEEIARSCSSFIRKSNDGQFFEFSHFSVREYLQDISLLQRPDLALYHVSRQDTYHALAVQSLRFLLLKNFDRTLSLDFHQEAESVRKTDHEFPLYRFGALNWPLLAHRAREMGMLQSSEILDLEKILLDPRKSTNYKKWLVSFCIHINGHDWRFYSAERTTKMIQYTVHVLLARKVSTLHIAGALNLVEVGTWLIDHGALGHFKNAVPTVLDFAVAGVLAFTGGEHMNDLYGSKSSTIPRETRLREDLLARDEIVSYSAFWKPNATMFDVAWKIATRSGGYSSIQCVLASGWILSPQDISIIRAHKLPTKDQDDETRIFDFLVYLNSSELYKSELGSQFCAFIWNHSINAGYKFTADKLLLPTQITASDDFLYLNVMIAVREDDLATLKIWEHDPRFDYNMTTTDEERLSLLHIAVRWNSLEVLEHLLSVPECDIDRPDWMGRTPLHYIAGGILHYTRTPDEHQVIIMLIEAGASLAVADTNGLNVVCHCVDMVVQGKSSIQNLRSFLQYLGADDRSLLYRDDCGDSNAPESRSSTFSAAGRQLAAIGCCSGKACAWDISVSCGSVEVIRALIDAKFPRHPDHSDGRPFQSMHSEISFETFQLLKSLYSTNLHGRSEDGNLPVMTFLSKCVNQASDRPNGTAFKNIDVRVIRALLDASPPLSPTLDQALDFCCGLLRSLAPTQKKMELIAPFLDYGFNMHPMAPSPSTLSQAVQSFFSIPATTESKFLMSLILDHVGVTGLNQLNSAGFSILHKTFKPFDADREWFMLELIKRGADLNIRAASHYRETPLVAHLCASSIKSAIILLKSGADPNLASSLSWNAVQAAIIRGSGKFLMEVLKLTDSSSFCVDWTRLANVLNDKHGERFKSVGLNVLHLASLSGSLECFNLIVNKRLHTDIQSTTRQGYNCMHFAAWKGSKSMIKHLHKLGVRIDQVSTDGSTPLHMAVRANANQAVQKLLELGSPIMANSAGETPIMVAKRLKFNDILVTLFKLADFHNMNTGGYFFNENLGIRYLRLSIEKAIRANNSTECERLLSGGCPVDVSMPSCGGCSPLLLSLAHYRSTKRRLIELFLNHSASVSKTYCVNHGSGSALQNALCLPNLYPVLPKMLDLALKEHWTCISSVLIAQMIRCNAKALVTVLAHLEANRADYAHILGCSPEVVVSSVINGGVVHQAVLQNDVGTIKLLIQYGADMNALDAFGRTPLHICKHEELARCLLSIGATPVLPPWNIWYGLSSESIESLTSLCEQVAQVASSLGGRPTIPELLNRQVLSSFIGNGSNLDMVDNVGGSVLHLAMYSYVTGNMVLNGSARLTGSKPFPWHQMYYPTQYASWIGPLWRYYRRRFHVEDLIQISNLHPDRGWSPMCLATCTDDTRVMAHCLEMGTDIDFEGSPYGSALMAAAFSNRLESVKFLVRSGASICYKGKDGFKSAVVIGKRCQRVIDWLIMGRFRDQDKLEGIPAPGLEADDSPQATTGVWSSTLAPLRLIGHFERQPHESSLSYLHRLAIIKRGARGKVVPLPRPEVLSSMVFTATYHL